MNTIRHRFRRLQLALVLLLLVGEAATLAGAETPLRQAAVAVKGLACPFCVYGLEKHLKKLSGVQRVRVELGKGEALLDFPPDTRVTDDQIGKAVREAGFTPGKIEWRPVKSPPIKP